MSENDEKPKLTMKQLLYRMDAMDENAKIKVLAISNKINEQDKDLLVLFKNLDEMREKIQSLEDENSNLRIDFNVLEASFAVKEEEWPDRRCWLCHRDTDDGAKVVIRAGNGFFSLFMCGKCQQKFRVG
jgi:hypothetical protein